MSDELEKSLRSALRPVDPGEKFTQDVLAAASRPRHDALTSHPAFHRAALRWASATLVVVLSAGIFAAHQWQVHRTQQGLEARRQLFQALHVTGENLDMAYRMVNNQ
jgi:hypothetical protein